MMTTEEYNDKPTGSNDGRCPKMTDLIPRDDAIEAVNSYHQITHIREAIRAIPTIDPAAIRDAAMREAEKISDYHATRNGTASDVLRDIRRALIGEKK